MNNNKIVLSENLTKAYSKKLEKFLEENPSPWFLKLKRDNERKKAYQKYERARKRQEVLYSEYSKITDEIIEEDFNSILEENSAWNNEFREFIAKEDVSDLDMLLSYDVLDQINRLD